jgi:hypothetical protein
VEFLRLLPRIADSKSIAELARHEFARPEADSLTRANAASEAQDNNAEHDEGIAYSPIRHAILVRTTKLVGVLDVGILGIHRVF